LAKEQQGKGPGGAYLVCWGGAGDRRGRHEVGYLLLGLLVRTFQALRRTVAFSLSDLEPLEALSIGVTDLLYVLKGSLCTVSSLWVQIPTLLHQLPH
jgi:hypothetical protein